VNTPIENRIGLFLAAWTQWVCKFSWWVIIGFLLAAGGSIYYSVTHLSINTDTKEMLNEKLAYRQTLKTFQLEFPQLRNTLIIVISGPDSDSLNHASLALSQALRKNTSIFDTIYQPGSGRFFDQNGLLYLPLKEVESLTNKLIKTQPLLAQLQKQNNAVGLFAAIHQASLAKSHGQTQIELTPLLQQTNLALAAYISAKEEPLSWSHIMLQKTPAPSNHQQLILVQPRTDYSKLSAASTALKTIRQLASELQIDQQHGFQLGITGNAALADDEMKSVSKGMGLSAGLAFFMVVIILWFGTGSFRVLLFSIICLVVGLSLTAGFATLAVGSLNLISVAFALLYIGLGIDFSIHLCLRYEELLPHSDSNLDALSEASKDVGSSLVICAVSTAIGFYAFVPTDFVGVSELGIISGTGMFISLVVSMSLLPALFSLSPLKKPAKLRLHSLFLQQLLATLPAKHGNKVLVISLLLGIVATVYSPQVRFDYDMLNMREQKSESVQVFRDLSANSDFSPWRLTVLANSRQQVLDYQGQLLSLPSVKNVITEYDLIPTQQDEKLRLINQTAEQLSNTLDPKLPATSGKTTVAELKIGLSNIAKVVDLSLPWHSQLQLLQTNLEQVIVDIENQSGTEQTQKLAALEQTLMGTFPTTINRIKTILGAQAVSFDTLPADLVDRWSSKNHIHRLLVFAKRNLGITQNLRQFVTEVSQISPQVTDLPAIHLAAGEAAIAAFQQAFISAIVLISILLLVLLRNLRQVLIVMAPLLLAGVFTASATVLFAIPFNFANIIALPLLLGIGVDSGIHMVSRARTDNAQLGNLMQTSTPRAVLLSALTTIASFGTLGLSSHPGTASMGQLLTIGVLLTMLCTLLVLPSLLSKKPV